MMVAARPASPKVRIRSESENCSARNGDSGGGVGQHAGRSDHQHGVAERGNRSSPASSRSRAANVSCIESEKLMTMISGVITLRNMLRLKSRPAENAERQQNGEQRRERRHDHERYLAEEQDRDQASRQDAGDVVDQAVALDRVADLELHDRDARQFLAEPGIGEIGGHDLADFADRLFQSVVADNRRLQREHDQRQRAVFRQQLAADDLVGFDGFDELVVVGALRQIGRKQRRGQLARRRRLTRREQRDQAARAFDQLQVRDQVPDLLQVFPPQQSLAFDHDQHVEFGGGEALGDFLVLPVFLGVGTEQLAERIVDLDAIDAEHGADHHREQDDAGQDGRAHGDQAHALQAERDAYRRLLQHLRISFDRCFSPACPIQFSHRLNLSSLNSSGAKETELATSDRR